MNKRIKVFIAEDDVFISEQLKDILLELDYEVTDIGFNTESAIASLKNEKPNVAILDIKMHGSNDGFKIAEYINEYLKIPYIFLTSFSDKETVKEATSLSPSGYLLKPFDERDIYTTLEVVLKNSPKAPEEIIITIGHSKMKINPEDILWIKSDDKYIEIQTTSKKYVQRNSISSFLETHEIKSLERVHRSYAVNTDKIDVINSNHIVVGGQEIPVSRNQISRLRDVFGE